MKVAQLCPTLCNPMDYTVHGILQARIPEWVAFPFSRGSSQPRDWTQVSCIAGGFFTEISGKPLFLVLNHHFLRHRRYTLQGKHLGSWWTFPGPMVQLHEKVARRWSQGHLWCLPNADLFQTVCPQPLILGNWKKFPQHTFSWFHLLILRHSWLCPCAGA